MSRIILSSIFLLITITPASYSQQKEAQFTETVEIDLVDLVLTAIDKKGHFVTDLKPEELSIKENGVVQKISSFGDLEGSDSYVPLNLAFLIDSSSSMNDEVDGIRKLDMAKNAATMVIAQLHPEDKMMVSGFAQGIRPTPLSLDRQLLRNTIQDFQTEFKFTALFDAITQTIDLLNQEEGRKVLVICSDGLDNISKTKFEDVLEKASGRTELTIIVFGTIGYQDPRSLFYGENKTPHRGKVILQKLADRTGGFAFFPGNLKEIQNAQNLIGSFVRSQYSLAYESTNRAHDGSWRKIAISCKRKGITLHYREGYFAR
ncbi:VWA domain-containing protein [bacterium]|nr:VWA domain-containing protein [bacterium]